MPKAGNVWCAQLHHTNTPPPSGLAWQLQHLCYFMRWPCWKRFRLKAILVESESNFRFNRRRWSTDSWAGPEYGAAGEATLISDPGAPCSASSWELNLDNSLLSSLHPQPLLQPCPHHPPLRSPHHQQTDTKAPAAKISTALFASQECQLCMKA